MAEPINNVKDFELQVAATLGATLEIELTAETIDMPKFAGAAMAKLNAIVPNIDDTPQDEPNRIYADIAIINQTAILLIPHMRLTYQKISQSPSEKVEKFEPNWEELAANLQAEIDGAISVLDPDYIDSGSNFVGFMTTRFGDPCGRCPR